MGSLHERSSLSSTPCKLPSVPEGSEIDTQQDSSAQPSVPPCHDASTWHLPGDPEWYFSGLTEFHREEEKRRSGSQTEWHLQYCPGHPAARQRTHRHKLQTREPDSKSMQSHLSCSHGAPGALLPLPYTWAEKIPQPPRTTSDATIAFIVSAKPLSPNDDANIQTCSQLSPREALVWPGPSPCTALYDP